LGFCTATLQAVSKSYQREIIYARSSLTENVPVEIEAIPVVILETVSAEVEPVLALSPGQEVAAL
jgi:hypothetical protein